MNGIEEAASPPLQAADLSPSARVTIPWRKLPTRQLRVARVLSDVFNPQWIGMPILLLISLKSAGDYVQGFLWWCVCVSMLFVPTRMYLSRGLRRNKFSDREVSVRGQRTPFYLFALSMLALMLTAMIIFKAPAPLFVSMLGAFVAGALGMLINFKWKISVHGGGIGTVSAMLYWVLGPNAFFIAVPVAVAVGWSRVVLLQHTPAQVLAGFSVSCAIVLLMYRFFGV